MTKIGLGHKIICVLDEADKLVNNEFQPFVTCEIDLSNYCQNRCNFCMFADYLHETRTVLPFNLALKTITELARLGTKSITFTGGGEPLTHPNFQGLSKWVKMWGIDLGLVTNGILLDKIFDIVDDFRYIRVSLNAATRETYRKIMNTSFFDNILNNIRNIVDGGYKNIGIGMVVTEENKHEVEEFKKLGKDLGVAYVQVKPSITEGDCEKATEGIKENGIFLTERYKVDKKDLTACKLAGLVGIICADQKMYYCCIHRGNPSFKIGDVGKESMKDIIERRRSFKPDISQCNSCRYMNYVKVYNEVKDRKFTVLRHRRFV